ncbi:MAG TPA: hypothetical protein VJ911_10635 [Cryomorphaceae bacterium]|nr:hypothetical protein [Cryomorphaceae bacterium]
MMKNSILIALCAFCISTAAFGQISEQIEQESKAITEEISNKIELTDQQNQLIYRQVYTYTANAIKMDNVENRTEKMDEMLVDLHQRYVDNVKGIVTEEQYAKISEIVEKNAPTAK